MASLITAERADKGTLTLVRTGFVHSRRFIVYVEIVDFRDLEDNEFKEGADVQCEAV